MKARLYNIKIEKFSNVSLTELLGNTFQVIAMKKFPGIMYFHLFPFLDIPVPPDM